MRVGYLIDTNVLGGGSLDDIIEEGLLAERAGFHGVFAPDRHGRPECAFPGPEQLLTVLARETSRVLLGSYTFVGTLVHPMKAAEQFAVIDRLSGGRLVTTVSRGFLPAFWDQFGVPQERLLGRLQETLRIWRAAASGEPFSVDGEFWGSVSGRLAPPPAQEGGWPIWGGGNASVEAIRRSASYASAWTSDPMPMTRSAWEADVDAYRSRAGELGKQPFVVLMRNGWVADSAAEAASVFGEHFVRIARFYRRTGNLRRHPGMTSDDDITVESVTPHLLMGDAATCIERLVSLHEEWGVDYVVFCCRVTTGPPMEAAREQILRFGEEVVQPVHARYPAPDHPAVPEACRW